MRNTSSDSALTATSPIATRDEMNGVALPCALTASLRSARACGNAKSAYCARACANSSRADGMAGEQRTLHVCAMPTKALRAADGRSGNRLISRLVKVGRTSLGRALDDILDAAQKKKMHSLRVVARRRQRIGFLQELARHRRGGPPLLGRGIRRGGFRRGAPRQQRGSVVLIR